MNDRGEQKRKIRYVRTKSKNCRARKPKRNVPESQRGLIAKKRRA